MVGVTGVEVGILGHSHVNAGLRTFRQEAAEQVVHARLVNRGDRASEDWCIIICSNTERRLVKLSGE